MRLVFNGAFPFRFDCFEVIGGGGEVKKHFFFGFCDVHHMYPTKDSITPSSINIKISVFDIKKPLTTNLIVIQDI